MSDRRRLLSMAAIVPILGLASACAGPSYTPSPSSVPRGHTQLPAGPFSLVDVPHASAAVCDTFTTTEVPSVETVQSMHAAGHTGYGAHEPSEILERMARGEDPATGAPGDGDPQSADLTAYFNGFAESVRASSAPEGIDELNFAAPGVSGGSLHVRRVAGRWFPTEWSAPRPCTP